MNQLPPPRRDNRGDSNLPLPHGEKNPLTGLPRTSVGIPSRRDRRSFVEADDTASLPSSEVNEVFSGNTEIEFNSPTFSESSSVFSVEEDNTANTGDLDSLALASDADFASSFDIDITDFDLGSIGGVEESTSGSSNASTGAGDSILTLEEFNSEITSSGGSSDGFDIDKLLSELLARGGSDLHLSAKNYPAIRVNGEMVLLKEYGVLSGAEIKTSVYSILTSQQKERFEKAWELDLAYNLPGKSRFRVNLMKQKNNVSVVMRAIPWQIKSAEELGLPEVIKTWATLPRGLVLITGPTGSGKSTTLASIIDYANRTRAGHIVTIEDPIEFVHDHQKSVINQREVGEDTHSFADALKHVLRQDPDIILVGELRDLETISVAVTAAETGHLVFATLHTQSAEETISRIIDVFPEGGQAQIRTQLSTTLQGVACQTLLKTSDNKGRVAAVEIMVATPAVRSLIREGKTHQLKSALESGGKHGMQTIDRVLLDLVRSGQVRWQDAAEKATNYNDFISSLGGEKGLIELDRANSRRIGIVK